MNLMQRSICAAAIVSIPLYSQNPISSEEYETKLSELQERDKNLREQIAQEQATILELQKKIEASRTQIKALRQKKLTVLGVSREDVAVASQAILLLSANLKSFENLPDHQFVQDTGKFSDYKIHYDNLLSNPAVKMPELARQIIGLEQSITRCEQRIVQLSVQVEKENSIPEELAAPVISSADSDSYTVKKNRDGKPETLFIIAQKVYGNPQLWPRIYNANKIEIDRNYKKYTSMAKMPIYTDPSNLIYPGQVLVIPR